MKNIKNIIILGILVMFASSCDKEYLDPNSTLEPDVVNSTDNLVALINGVQQRWSTDRAGIIYTSTHLTGLNTGELRLLNPGNLGENEVLLGGDDINGGNEILNNIWTNAMLCRKEATTVITSADIATDDATTANSLKAYGLFYRALVHGTLIQFFESIPLEIIEDASFQDRSTVLQSVITDLTEARGYVQAGLSSEITSGVFSSVDIGNSIDAMLARFHLMAGNYTEAISAADAVDLSVQSTWEYDASIPNPLAFWFGSQNVTQARDANFALPAGLVPDPSDERVPFYVTLPDPVNDPANYQLIGFWPDNLIEIPVYLPGEMLLIKAEAYARSNDLTNAVTELDAVLTKTAAQDAFGVGANLPAYAGAVEQQAVLDEIYRNRRIELYLTSLGLEDSRRFGRPGPSDANPERNRNFYPYPNAERDNNDNTPANPSL
ncbi:RagB/SusD family nutrient uptake outer membrane protein [Allomuricauda sp. SCSIO 65647]|uniref:RagB/SusD family nutrient uptake outer membrane protein n=1 Tax=Allomuricauda sp. SCSIO 65647 TaxID=2908843 RepID=UPI001F204FD3|nr:RagB/SusD family nutrient uptake outer membrane protein [Muricauda sp. SCSIO 65647]UJH66680.1 RagB/SusD family nutrient uptake outer membrane protein [Muricauda sp. SCSIO 65647]